MKLFRLIKDNFLSLLRNKSGKVHVTFLPDFQTVVKLKDDERTSIDLCFQQW